MIAECVLTLMMNGDAWQNFSIVMNDAVLPQLMIMEGAVLLMMMMLTAA
jgi:hypothetical protein